MDILQELKETKTVYCKQTKAIQMEYARLRNGLSKEEGKHLLRIIDEKDLLIEQAAYQNFELGFKAGM